jgi:hypothetical protein
MNLLKELERAKAISCKCKLLKDETKTQNMKHGVYLGDSEFENAKTNHYTNLHTKSTISLKKNIDKNKSFTNSLEEFRFDETNSEIQQEPDIKISKKKNKFLRSSSVVCTPTFKTCVMEDHTPRNRIQNISQFNIDLNCKKMDIDELFDDGMENLIRSLQASKTDDTRKNLMTVEKLNNDYDSNLLSKGDQRKKLLVEFKSNCNENKKMLKSMAKNTQSKVKGFMEKNYNQANGQKNVGDCLGRLESDSIINIGSNRFTSEEKVKGKNLKENKTKLNKLDCHNKSKNIKLQSRNNSVSIV